MTTRAAPWLRRTAVPPARRWAAVATPAPRRAGPAARPAARAFAATAQRSPWFAHFYRGPERPEANGAAAVPAATVSDAFPADVADAVEFDVSELAVLSRALGERLRRGRADDVGETDDVGKAHVFDSLALEAVAKMKSFAPAALASLSVTLVGLATQRALDGTGQRPAEAALYGRQLDLIANESAKKIRRFNANELARLTRSFARLPRSRSHDALFAAVADVAPRRLGQLSPPQTAYLLWASAGRLGADHRGGARFAALFDAVAPEFVEGLDSAELANATWAYGRAAHLVRGAAVVRAAARKAAADVAGLRPRHISKIAEGLDEWATTRLKTQKPRPAPEAPPRTARVLDDVSDAAKPPPRTARVLDDDVSDAAKPPPRIARVLDDDVSDAAKPLQTFLEAVSVFFTDSGSWETLRHFDTRSLLRLVRATRTLEGRAPAACRALLGALSMELDARLETMPPKEIFDAVNVLGAGHLRGALRSKGVADALAACAQQARRRLPLLKPSELVAAATTFASVYSTGAVGVEAALLVDEIAVTAWPLLAHLDGSQIAKVVEACLRVDDAASVAAREVTFPKRALRPVASPLSATCRAAAANRRARAARRPFAIASAAPPRRVVWLDRVCEAENAARRQCAKSAFERLTADKLDARKQKTNADELAALDGTPDVAPRDKLQQISEASLATLASAIAEASAATGTAEAAKLLLTAVANETRARLRFIEPKTFIRVLNACSFARLPHVRLFKAVDDELSRKRDGAKLDLLEAPELVQLIVAFDQTFQKTYRKSASDVDGKAWLFHAVADRLALEGRCAAMSLKQLAKLAAALAGLGLSRHRPTFDAIAEAVVAGHGMAPQDAVDLAWSFARAKQARGRVDLFRALAASLAESDACTKLDDAAWAKVAWAFGVAGVRSDELLGVVSRRLDAARLAAVNPRAAVDVLWAYAVLRKYDANLFDGRTLRHMAVGRLGDHSAATLAWALAAADGGDGGDGGVGQGGGLKGAASPAVALGAAYASARHRKALGAVRAGLAKRLDGNAFDRLKPEDLATLHVVHTCRRLGVPGLLFGDADGGGGGGGAAALTLAFARRADRLSGAYRSEFDNSSESQREVSRALDRLGKAHAAGHFAGAAVRVSAARLGAKMAVEFNGPSHYCHVVSLAAPHGSAATGAPEMARRGTLLLNGKARLKQRILELSGWTGIHVSFFEWDAARGDHRAQDVLLRRKLAAHAVSPAAADPHGETVAKKRRKSGEKATDLLHAEKAAPAAKRPEDDAYEVYDVSDTWR